MADIVPFDVDEATYVGDEKDGCYYQCVQHTDGKWYVTVVVDSETGAFVDTLVKDDGPYDDEPSAQLAGRDAATTWCIDNGVNFQEGDQT